MKRIIIISLVVLFNSCNKKEEEQNRNNLIGTWVAISQSIVNCMEENENIDRELTCSDENISECYIYTFDEEGVYTITEGEFGGQGEYAIKESDISFCEEDEGELICIKGSFSVGPMTLTIITTDEETGCTSTLEFEKSEN